MRIAVCDDDKQEILDITGAIAQWDPTRVPECFTTGEELIKAAVMTPHFSIVFLDIYFPKDNGMDIARQLMQISPDTEIVFVTTSSEFAVDAFSIHALHYLIKPVTVENVREAFYRLTQRCDISEPALSISVGRSIRRIYLKNICVVQSINHATEIYLAHGESVKVWISLEEISAGLDERFLKIQRGIIVNMSYIEQMGSDSCILRDGTKLLLSRKEKKAIRDTYTEYAFRNISGN